MNNKEREFQAFVLDWYDKCVRHDLLWRQPVKVRGLAAYHSQVRGKTTYLELP